MEINFDRGGKRLRMARSSRGWVTIYGDDGEVLQHLNPEDMRDVIGLLAGALVELGPPDDPSPPASGADVPPDDQWQTTAELEAQVEGEAVFTVRRWIAAVSNGDIDTMLELSEGMEDVVFNDIAARVSGTESWVVASRPRPIRPDVEDIILADPATTPAVITRPTLIPNAVTVRVKHTADGFRIIAFVHPDESTFPEGR